MTKQAVWKKTAMSSLAVLMLTGGAASAFANGSNQSNNSQHKDKDQKQESSKNGNSKDKKEKKVTWKFKDEDDLKWATEHIMRLASKGVFTGYEDGTFKPNQTISRIETLVAAVRLMGLQEQAESKEELNTQLNFRDSDLIQKKYPWAVGYVAVAVENDLFAETDTEVKPQANATRLWAATILIKALKLEDEAKALNNTKLDFKDAKEIPAGSVGYVALALKKGIITGYSDKTFRPNQSVSRAELAALLDRTNEELPDHDAQAITGTLKGAVSGNKITVVKADKTEVTLDLDANVFIFRDDKKSPSSALKAGDELLVRTYQNRVVFIEVTKKAAESTAFAETGNINTVTLNSQGKLSTITITKVVSGQTYTLIYNVSANVKITGDASLIAKDQLVTLQGDNGTVKAITIKKMT